jgi:hypothetical protein
MQKVSYKIFLIVGLIILCMVAGASAYDGRGKNSAILSVKTSPESMPVFVDGQQVGMSGVGKYGADFYVTPGVHRVEVRGPEGHTFDHEYTFVKNRRECVCLKVEKTPHSRPCPYDVHVDAQENVLEGASITFSAINAVTASVPLHYRWTVEPSGFVITSGVDTNTITVSTEGMGGQTVTAYLDVTDDVYGATCMQKNSAKTIVEKKPPLPTSVPCDTFVSRSHDDDKARLDNCVINVQSNPDDRMYIILYQGTDKRSINADKLGRRTRDYLVKNRGVDPGRITITKGGFRPQTTMEVWTVPPGASLPIPH